MSFTVKDASLLLVWLIFVLIQFYYPTKQRDLDYYNAGRPHLYIFRIPWQVYPFIFLFTFGPLIPSIFLFQKWHVNVDIAVYILFISLLILDKLWFVLFFKWKQSEWTIFVTAIMLTLTTIINILMALAEQTNANWWVPFVLMIPFWLLMVHLFIFACDWHLQSKKFLTNGKGSAYQGKTKQKTGSQQGQVRSRPLL